MAGTTKGRKSWKASCSESEAHSGLGLRGVKPLWRTDARFKMTRFSEVSRRFYVLHSVVPFEEDTTHEFKGHRNISIEEIPPWCFIPGTDRRSRKAVSRWAKIFSVQENDWGFNIAISEILNFEEITIKMGEKNVAVLSTRDHSVEYNLQVDVKYGLSRDRQTTLKVIIPLCLDCTCKIFKFFWKRKIISPWNEASRINYHKDKTITKFAVIYQRSIGGWVRKEWKNNNNNNNKNM